MAVCVHHVQRNVHVIWGFVHETFQGWLYRSPRGQKSASQYAT